MSSTIKILTFLYLYSLTANALNVEWHKKSCLNHVISSINSLSTRGKVFNVSVQSFFKKHEYKNTLFNRFGLDNHFQGITYVPKKNLVILSGANINNKSASLFFISTQKKIEMIERYDIDISQDLWHAGGITYADDILFLPMERFKPSFLSQIHFLSLKNIQRIAPAASSLTITENKTGSTDIIFEPQSEKNLLFSFDTKEIRIYRSKNKSLNDGFELLRSLKTKIFNGSNMKLLQQCDGKIFIADLTNTGLLPPFINAKNTLTLYTYNHNEMSIHKVLEKNFSCDKSCNFRGAASLTTEDNQLKLISSNMFRDNSQDTITFTLFE